MLAHSPDRVQIEKITLFQELFIVPIFHLPKHKNMKKTKRVLAFKDRSIFKLLLLMKFTIALLLLTTWQASAKSYSQERITLKLQSTELRTALRQIEKKSIFRFL